MTIRGEIVSAKPVVGSITVELSGNGIMPTESAIVNPDNTFEFHSVTSGSHELRVIGGGGQVLHQEIVTVSSPMQVLSIRLPDAPNANRSSGSVISLQQLSHKVPAPARKAFNKGEHAIGKGNLPQAQSSFEEAVSIDPEFADAHNELGCVYLRLNHLPEAAEQFQKAIDLVPRHPLALPNLSIALAKLRRMSEAGEVARRALQIVPNDGRMHYILAVSILDRHGATDEAIAEFERAAATVPAAHLAVADLLAKRGRSQDAIQHLETFLSTAPANDVLRAKAEARLAALRQGSPFPAR